MGRRRANGEGSIICLKNKNLKKPFLVRISTNEWTAGGNPKRKPLDYFATRPEAEAFLAKYTRRPILKYNFTLEEVYNEWLEKRKKKVERGTLSRKALECNTGAWKWLSSLKKEKVRLITSDQIEDVLEFMAELEQSKSGIEKVKSLTCMLFEYAMEYDIVDRNYAKFVEMPDAPEGSRDRWSDIERIKIEKAAEDGVEWADCIVMMIYSGFRIEEFLTLKKFGATVADDGRILAVVGGIKTPAGRDRLMPIHPKAEKYWRKWYNFDPNSEYIIPKSACPLSRKKGRDCFNKNWWRENCYYACIEKINAQGGNIRKLTPHSCRHTFSSLSFAAGIAPEKIAILMGHSDFAHTKPYIHEDFADLNACITMIKS